MNATELAKTIGSLYRLRPLPWRFDDRGGRIEDRDDRWRLDSVDRGPTRVRLSNLVTNHILELEADNIVERRSPDFLMLRCQVSIRADAITIEPIFRGSPILPTDPDAPQPQALELTADERRLLGYLASEGGEVSLHSESHVDAGLNRIRFRHALEALQRRAYVNKTVNSRETRLFPRLALSAIGRRWVIEAGLA